MRWYMKQQSYLPLSETNSYTHLRKIWKTEDYSEGAGQSHENPFILPEELVIAMESHNVLMMTLSSCQSFWLFCVMTAWSGLCTPSYHTGEAGNSHKGLQCMQRLPVIPPEVVVVLSNIFPTIYTAAVDKLNLLQLFGLTHLKSWMIDSRSQIGGSGHTEHEPLSADIT